MRILCWLDNIPAPEPERVLPWRIVYAGYEDPDQLCGMCGDPEEIPWHERIPGCSQACACKGGDPRRSPRTGKESPALFHGEHGPA